MKVFALRRTPFEWWLLLSIGTVLLMLWRGMFPFAVYVGISLIWFFSYHLKLGWYILVFLSPMIHWFFRFSDYWYLFTEYPQILGIYAPVIDFWAVLLTLAFALHVGRELLYGRRIQVKLPGIWLFGLFVGSAFLSLWYVAPLDRVSSVYQIIRQLMLLYVGYIVLGANIMKTKEDVLTSLKIFLGVGVFAGVMGAVSLLTGASLAEFGYLRAVPFALGTWAPFGFQHIFLGEIITVAIPIAVYFWHRATEVSDRTWYRNVSMALIIIALLTLSRAAWIVLFVQLFVLFVVMKPSQVFQIIRPYMVPIVLATFAVVSYFTYFLLFSPQVSSSTSARLLLTDVSAFMFLEHPVVGNGFWSFLPYSDGTVVVQSEIGGGEDAHGILQKVLSEQGIVGLITFSLFFLYFLYPILRSVYRKKRGELQPYALLALSLILAPLLFQLFSTQYYTSKFWVPVILAWALVQTVHAKKTNFI